MGEWRDESTPRFIVTDVVRGQWEANRRERTIKQTAQVDRVKVTVGLEQEPGSGGKESAQNTVRNLAGFRVKVYNVGQSDGNKVLRADPFSAQVNAGAVSVLNRDWTKDFIDELRHFPGSTFKDQVDAAAGAFNMLTRTRTRVGAL